MKVLDAEWAWSRRPFWLRLWLSKFEEDSWISNCLLLWLSVAIWVCQGYRALILNCSIFRQNTCLVYVTGSAWIKQCCLIFTVWLTVFNIDVFETAVTIYIVEDWSTLWQIQRRRLVIAGFFSALKSSSKLLPHLIDNAWFLSGRFGKFTVL